MKIITRKTHTYAAKLRRPGDIYQATPDHARFLVREGFAEFPQAEKPAEKPTYQTRAVEAEKPKAAASEPKREYKRKDMTAEEGKG